MDERSAGRIRVILRWVQILEGGDTRCRQFHFTSRVSSPVPGGLTKELRFPEEGYYDIADHPAWNKVVLNRTVFDGTVQDHMIVEIAGTALDAPAPARQLDTYRREFKGDPETWAGWYGPGDDTSAWITPDDPETMSSWRLCYVIESAL